MRKSLWKAAAALAVFGLLAAACSGDDDTVVAEPESTPTSAAGSSDAAEEGMDDEGMAEEDMAADLGEITTIKLIANPWTGSAANIEVAKQILENELGYTVEVTDLDENAQWSAINTGDLHASLEVWPSGHAENRIDFIDNPDGNVADAGLLGPVGKIGWYVPTYMVEQYPDLATWEGYRDPELAGKFATAETGDSGQFLTGDPSWVANEQDIIDNLGLDLEIVFAGSEEAIVAAFDAAISRDDPVLAYFWTPHAIHDAYDLTEVQLPQYSDECYESGAVDCDYPADLLFKIVWAGLEDGAPAAWNLLHNFNYTTTDQIGLLAAIEAGDMTTEEAAADWIASNENIWRPWLM